VALASMTGFARADGEAEGLSWAWEVKSVNGKGLDLRLRVPPGWDQLEPALRGAVAARLKRGNVSVNLNIDKRAASGTLRINREVLGQVVALMREIGHEVDAAAPRLDGLLTIRGVIEAADEEEVTPEQREGRAAALLASFETVLARLAEMREGEGARLSDVLHRRLDEIATLVAEAESSAAAQPEAIRARLRELVASLVEAGATVSEDRLAQEAALLVGRADVREELDRLEAHVAAARDLLHEGTAIGRRFDFLCQEFNREANTLCSKSSDLELTRIGLALKSAIEQLREQVQNVE
jgi:uncharacterized protein (TIGR00255 family)